MRPAKLVLEDGAVFFGELAADGADMAGEVVFNTALTGYQEVMTDPSYAGQMVVLTYPLIGSYGTAAAWAESSGPAARVLIVHRLEAPSHARSEHPLALYCRTRGVGLLTGVDTRALTRHLRTGGTRRGAVVSVTERDGAALDLARRVSLAGIVDTVSTPAAYAVGQGGPHLALIDYGLKTSIIDALRARGARLTVLPARTSVSELAALAPDGVVLSNGPGDPEDLADRLEVIRWAIAERPTLGICLGHQLVALALGGRTYALKFGHHGSNHPVLDYRTGAIQITAQNHGYAVDADRLPPHLQVRFVNLHDGTVEGLAHTERPLLTVQHHPEAAPGPREAAYVFDEFLDWVKGDTGA
jgi:carbamoyl-phosphate synthase small subunit